MPRSKEGPALVILCLILVGFLGWKHGSAYLNRPSDFRPIAYEDANGQHEWSPEGSSTLVVFFKTTCPACSENLPVWEKLYRARCADLRFLFLSAEPLETVAASEYADLWEQEGCAPPMVGRAVDPKALQDRHDLQGVPNQFLVAGTGKVQAIILGGSSEEQVFLIFGNAQ